MRGRQHVVCCFTKADRVVNRLVCPCQLVLQRHIFKAVVVRRGRFLGLAGSLGSNGCLGWGGVSVGSEPGMPEQLCCAWPLL
jgi:hypothetical protein